MARGAEFIQQGEAGMAIFFRESSERAAVEGEFPCLPCIARGEGCKILPDSGKNVDNS
jgi:hypothetical protein